MPPDPPHRTLMLVTKKIEGQPIKQNILISLHSRTEGSLILNKRSLVSSNHSRILNNRSLISNVQCSQICDEGRPHIIFFSSIFGL